MQQLAYLEPRVVGDASHERPPAPSSIVHASQSLVALAVVQALVATLLITHVTEIASAIRTANPGMPEGALATAVRGVVGGGVLVHLIMIALHLWLAAKLRTRAGWTRLATTALCIIGMAGGLSFLRSASTLLPAQMPWVVALQTLNAILRVVVIALLWAPLASRRFYVRGTAAIGLACAGMLVPNVVVAQRTQPTADDRDHPTIADDSRFEMFGKDLLGGLGSAIPLAAIGQFADDPDEWDGSWDGYGKRVASTAGQQVAQIGVTHALAAAFDRPPRYAPSRYPTRRQRFRSALAGAVSDRTSSGGHVVSWARILGPYAGAAAQTAWLPGDRNHASDIAVNGTTALAISAVVNLGIERRAAKHRHDAP